MIYFGRHIMKIIDEKTIQDAAPVSPSTGWKEVVEADEQALFEDFAQRNQG